MVNRLASLTATTSVVDTTARIVQILLEKAGAGAQEPIFHAVRIWVPRSLLIYLRRRLPDLPSTKRASALGTIVLPWSMEVVSPRNIDIRMPNQLCSHLQTRFLHFIKQRFWRITSTEQYEKLFPRKVEQLHFQLAFYHLDNPTVQPYFGGLHAFLRNNFPAHLPADYVAPLRILACNPSAARTYANMLDELLQSAPPHRTEIDNFAEDYGVLFFQPNTVEFARVLKAAKTRTRAISVSEPRSGRRPACPNQSPINCHHHGIARRCTTMDVKLQIMMLLPSVLLLGHLKAFKQSAITSWPRAMSVLLAAPLVEWQTIRIRGIQCPPDAGHLVLYQDIGSLPTSPDSNHILIWFNVLHLWQAGYEVKLQSSGTATCTGNSRGTIPNAQFIKVCWLALTLWTGGIDLTLQAMTIDPSLRRLLPPSPTRLRLRSRSPRIMSGLQRQLRCYLRPYRYGHDVSNPALALTGISRVLQQQLSHPLPVCRLHDLLAHRSVIEHFTLVRTTIGDRLIPVLIRRPLPAPLMADR